MNRIQFDNLLKRIGFIKGESFYAIDSYLFSYYNIQIMNIVDKKDKIRIFKYGVLITEEFIIDENSKIGEYLKETFKHELRKYKIKLLDE